MNAEVELPPTLTAVALHDEDWSVTQHDHVSLFRLGVSGTECCDAHVCLSVCLHVYLRDIMFPHNDQEWMSSQATQQSEYSSTQTDTPRGSTRLMCLFSCVFGCL